MAVGQASMPSSDKGQDPSTGASVASPAEKEVSPPVEVFRALASLKLTVWLFAAAILLVLFGTLAQKDYDVWHVVRETHFRVPIAWIELKSIGYLLAMVFPVDWSWLGGSFPFPGGVTIGAAMLVNLLAAHALRFKATARGSRLTGGMLVLALGILATLAVIALGGGDALKSDLSSSLAQGLWHTTRALLGGIALLGLYWLVGAYNRIRLPEWILSALLVASVTALAVWLLLTPEARLDNAGLRILWYVMQASASTIILLAGCWLVFGKRAGIVLLHGGIGLLMVGELATYGVDEGVMQIAEGQTVNYASDIRTTELAITDPTDPAGERVAVIPQRILASAAEGDVISHPELPVDVRVLRFDVNSTLGRVDAEESSEPNLATAGGGLMIAASPEPSVSGLADKGGNLPSAYVELLDKKTGASAGVYLASAWGEQGVPMLEDQQARVGDETYGVALRFKRLYKDYAIKLLDFNFGRYQGTNIAKDYRSEVQLLDPDRNVDRQVAIWMNNPLRYGGDTLYQQNFDKATEQLTVLQVVNNRSWMTPYVSCVVVAFGMLAHFSLTLGRFLRRRTEEASRAEASRAASQQDDQRFDPSASRSFAWQSPLVVGPVLVGLVWGGYLLSKARPAKDALGEMHVTQFGALPLAEGGRLKPYDSLARNTLQFLSARQEVLLPKPPLADDASLVEQLAYGMKRGDRIPAMEWMLDVISSKEGAGDHPVFRIENFEVLDLLDLERRPGSFRYSYNEIMTEENRPEIGKQLKLLGKTKEEEWTTFQARLAELFGKLNIYHALEGAFAPLRIGSDPANAFQELQLATLNVVEATRTRPYPGEEGQRRAPPRPIPPSLPSGDWLTFGEGQLNKIFVEVPKIRDLIANSITRFLAEETPSVRSEMFREEVTKLFERLNEAGPTPGFDELREALAAYADGDTLAFNAAANDLEKTLRAYQSEVHDPANADQVASLAKSERLSLAKARFEAFFTHFSPFYLCAASYLVAFILCAISWLAWPRGLGRAATAIIFVTFLVHTLAIIGRIYITSRPPVTNLYSSAVFIGWAIVFAGLAIEAIYKMGIGSILASVFGFLTLVIAHYLALDGDTYTVLQAVLDTQFWLATHVVAVTLGYVATFVAGGLGIIYLIRSSLVGNLPAGAERALPRMIYGTLCFGILFSFVGTVLGGLWGDNSWGRFWGWDPKENGALIIVLWNALVLHARWGGMISSRGLAALAVAGNICTTWSWFGTNELGVGLHSYGGISDGVSLELWIIRAVFWSHPIFIALMLAIGSAQNVRREPTRLTT